MGSRWRFWEGSWRRRWPLRALAMVFVVLVVVRVCLPYAVKSYVNGRLNKSQHHGGRIGNLDMQLWRGQYRIHDIEIYKRSGAVHEPLFAAKRVDLSIQWRELFHGALVGKVIMHEPQVNFVGGKTEDETQTGKNERWDKILSSLFPFKLNLVAVERGQIHFRNPNANPPVDVFLTNVVGSVTNLANSRKVTQELPAGLAGRADVPGGGGVDLQLRLDPMAGKPTYQLAAQVTNVQLANLNDFLKAYGKFDVQNGAFAVYASVAAKDGLYDGYLKVFFEHLNIFQWEKERGKNALEIFWQGIVGTAAVVLKNQSTDRLATRIPISGAYGDKSIGIGSAIVGVLRNAFVRALVPKLDETITPAEAEQKAGEKTRKSEPPPDPEKSKGAPALIKR